MTHEIDPGSADDARADDEVRRKAAPAWMISLAVHAAFVLLFAFIVIAARSADEEAPPVRIATIEPSPEPPRERPPRDPVEVPVEIDAPEAEEAVCPISDLDLEPEVPSSESEMEAEILEGRPEAVADLEVGGETGFISLGAGASAGGAYGLRKGGGRKRAVARGGGSRRSEASVEAALGWFKRHQSPDGRWSVVDHPANCREEGPKCEPGQHRHGGDADIACTGYALLCFLGAGYDHRMPRYARTVRTGLGWLVAAQQGDGLLGERTYEHAVAAMALAEAYAMTNDPWLREPAQRAVDLILRRQARTADGGYGLGWDYVTGSAARNDSSVSGWCVMALKSAGAAGLDVGDGLAGAKRWLRAAWEAANPGHAALRDPYADVSWFPYVYDAQAGRADGAGPAGSDAAHDLSSAGALCAVFLGARAGELMLETLCNHVMRVQLPQAWPTNTYYLYYNTLAMFQVGGPRWERWNGSVRDLLVGAQRRGDGCFDGSWDFQGTKFPGHEVGRLLSTAYCCLSLEVYYRYLPVAAR